MIGGGLNMECTKHDVVLEKIKTIEDRLHKTEKKTDTNTSDIQSLKENKVSSDEKFERIFSLLADLKESIDNIQKSIEKKNDRLPTLVYSIAGMIIGGSLSGIIVFLLTR
jgi:chromosome segregation ATPase